MLVVSMIGCGIFDNGSSWREPHVGIAFVNAVGTCTVNADGIAYSYGASAYPNPDVVYDEGCWGTYPLFLPNTAPTAGVSVTNSSSISGAEYMVTVEGYVVNADGSSGARIISPDDVEYWVDGATFHTSEVRVAVGRDKSNDFTVTFLLPPEAADLNRLFVKFYHPELPKTEDFLITTAEALFGRQKSVWQ
jgi:hypothetical protein